MDAGRPPAVRRPRAALTELVEVATTVQSLETMRGFSLRMLRVGKPRQIVDASACEVGLSVMDKSC